MARAKAICQNFSVFFPTPSSADGAAENIRDESLPASIANSPSISSSESPACTVSRWFKEDFIVLGRNKEKENWDGFIKNYFSPNDLWSYDSANNLSIFLVCVVVDSDDADNLTVIK